MARSGRLRLHARRRAPPGQSRRRGACGNLEGACPAASVRNLSRARLSRHRQAKEATLHDAPVVEPLQIRYQDLDPYGHVNNAVYLEYFESIRMAYWRALAAAVGTTPRVDGNVPGARYVIAETTVRYRSSIHYGEALFGAGRIGTVGRRSHTMEFELRCGDSFEAGRHVADGYAVHVFYDSDSGEKQPRPDWFLAAVADLEHRPQESFLAHTGS